MLALVVVVIVDAAEQCEVCGKWFSDHGKCSAHKALIHAKYSVARRYAVGSTCVICYRNFHTRSRLVLHLKRTGRVARCLNQLKQYQPILSEEQAAALDENERDRKKQVKNKIISSIDDDAPFMQVRGPVVRWKPIRIDTENGVDGDVVVVEQQQQAEHVNPEVNPDLVQARATEMSGILTEAAASETPVEEVVSNLDELWDAVVVGCGAFDCRAILKSVYEDLPETILNRSDDPDFVEAVNTWFERLIHSAIAKQDPYLESQNNAGPRHFAGRAPVMIEARQQQRLPQVELEQGGSDVQLCMKRETKVSYHGLAAILFDLRLSGPIYVVLSVFSGRRRYGDFQAQCEQLSAHMPYMVAVISVDLAVDDSCNMMLEENVRKWTSSIRQRQVLFMLIAPPCETWSQVRFLQVGDQPHKSPRPLRSAKHPWGILGLGPKENEQVHISSVLLMTTYRLLLACIKAGASAVAEHPDEPTDSYKPSIWKLAYTQWIVGVAGAELIKFNQSIHGQVSKKPTCFYSLRNPTLKQYLFKFQGPDCLKPESKDLKVLGGRVESGAWATAEAKEYPPSLCRALARNVIDVIQAGIGNNNSSSSNDTEHSGHVTMTTITQSIYEANFAKCFVTHDPYNTEQQTTIKADCMIHNRK